MLPKKGEPCSTADLSSIRQQAVMAALLVRGDGSKQSQNERPTRLKATATGEPVFAATSAACRKAQLSCTRWSRDILQGSMMQVCTCHQAFTRRFGSTQLLKRSAYQ